MSRNKKGTPYIPVQEYDMGAEFAGYQYNLMRQRQYNQSSMYQIFRDSIERLIMSNYKWYGIEPYEAHMIEWCLNYQGRVCAVKSEFNAEERTPDGIFYGFLGTDVPSVEYDFYGMPTSVSVSGFNDAIYRAESPDNFAICFDSMQHNRNCTMIQPIMTRVDVLCRELDDAYQAWKVAAETRKCGMVFNCTNERVAGILKDILKRVSTNDPYIVVQGDIGDNVEVLFGTNNTEAISEYHMNFMNVWGHIMDLLGLENNSQNKRERLVVTEAEMNRSLSRYIAADRLQARKLFAEELNKKFGLNVKVENYLASMVTESPNAANIAGDNNDSTTAETEGLHLWRN